MARGLPRVAGRLPEVAIALPRVAGGLPGVAMSLLRLARVLPVGRFLRNCLDALDAAYPSSFLGLPRVMGLVKRRDLGRTVGLKSESSELL